MFKNRRATKRLAIKVNTLATAQMAILDQISKTQRELYAAPNKTAKAIKQAELNGVRNALIALQAVELTK
jgi:hypothetical protein